MLISDLSDAEAALLEEMRVLLSEAILAHEGLLPFDRYMELALYAPGLGYYLNGRRKFGESGDFITAPEASPLFSRCLAHQVAECLEKCGGETVLEIGAGSGRMAAEMLAQLELLHGLPQRYLILELSAALQKEQRAALASRVPHLLSRVDWLKRLPDPGFTGAVVANELLDAMPVHRFRRSAGSWQELFVGLQDHALDDQWGPLQSPGLAESLQALWPDEHVVAEGYTSEINLRLRPWMRAVSEIIQRGYLIFIDYGYTQHEYYHPERRHGTFMCHFRHRAFSDPYFLPGLQDMTANVDFTALANAGLKAGFSLAGFTTQAHFLIDNGLGRLMGMSDPSDFRRHAEMVQGAKRLTLPSEMGERFKVLALVRGAESELTGFRSRDLRERL
ncbi:MAG: SAM-dependent methyltransferase [Sedimenticolaceae bacterium]